MAIQPKAFVQSLADTGRFSRSLKSQLLFEVTPGDFVNVAGRGAFVAICEEIGFQIPPELLVNDGSPAWTILIQRMWMLPRAGGRPTVRA